jgi:hypothetical protein
MFCKVGIDFSVVFEIENVLKIKRLPEPQSDSGPSNSVTLLAMRYASKKKKKLW